MSTLIILGSSDSNGNTRQVAAHLAQQLDADLIDLNAYRIGYFDYEFKNQDDDFLPLMERITVDYDTIIFATPVYWYTMSAVMKTFFDRISDLLKIRKDLGRRLRGKSMAVVSCSGDDDLVEGFAMPFRESADYLGMEYLGDYHSWLEADTITPKSLKNLKRLIDTVRQKSAV
ncbi:MAG: NADPH-dependent oxidoreductase [Bacteroidetes bacterium]|nr:MAG: NADPH-dependent oxidoreductase [Bacteroidota bacterium]